MSIAETRSRLAGSFNELLQAHTAFRENAARPLLLVDEKRAAAERAGLINRVGLAQQQAILSMMESLIVILDALQPQTKRAGADRPNGEAKPS